MKYLIQHFKKLHSRFDETFYIPPFMSVSLLVIYAIILGAFGYLLGIDLFSHDIYSLEYIFQNLMIRSLIILFFLNFNILILYFFIRFFTKRIISIPTIYAYYTLFGTVIFITALGLYFLVLCGHYLLNFPLNILLAVFGVSILIILTLTNLYPAILLFLALKHEPVDMFWPIMFCIISIHIMTFILFRMWNTVDILLLWL